MSAQAAARRLSDACDALRVPGVPYVYNPLAYAWEAHAAYCARFGKAPGRVLLLGMNPGPHGMAQTGVPFGDVVFVRDWMGIEATVGAPARIHPKRPITGFACKRREPSGSRLYGWAKERFGPADAFFSRFFVVNYCPLLFFDEAGTNLTPPQLPKSSREAVEAACDLHLAEVARTLAPALVIGVGGFAEARAQAVVDAARLDVRVGRILHPSPASPEANKGWAAKIEAQLAELGVEIPPRASPARGEA